VCFYGDLFWVSVIFWGVRDQSKNFSSLKRKNLTSLKPLRLAPNPLILLLLAYYSASPYLCSVFKGFQAVFTIPSQLGKILAQCFAVPNWLGKVPAGILVFL